MGGALPRSHSNQRLVDNPSAGAYGIGRRAFLPSSLPFFRLSPSGPTIPERGEGPRRWQDDWARPDASQTWLQTERATARYISNKGVFYGSRVAASIPSAACLETYCIFQDRARQLLLQTKLPCSSYKTNPLLNSEQLFLPNRCC